MSDEHVDHEARIKSLESFRDEMRMGMQEFRTKLDLLVLSAAKQEAVWSTILGFFKLSPIVVGVVSAIVGGVIWLIKHA